MNRFALLVLAVVSFAACGGRHQVVVSPVTVKPIHMTIDVNLNDTSDGAKPKRE